MTDLAEMAALVEKLQSDLERLQAQMPMPTRKPLSPRRVESIRRAQEARRIYTDEDKTQWKAIASLAEMAGHSKSNKAVLIAKRQGLSATAVRTIRRQL